MYEKNSRSRVFAPLAESYRKLGMHDEAFKVLNEGIRIHPRYTLGYIVLGHCYFDQQKYQMAYDTIKSFPADNMENLSLQKLYGACCLKLGYLDEALYTYKCLLLVNPKDQKVAEEIKLLEDDLIINAKANDENKPSKKENEDFDDDNWVQVNLREDDIFEKDEVNQIKVSLEQFRDEIKNKDLDVKQHSLDDQYFYEDYDTNSDDVITAEYNVEDSLLKEPIITHTLVDLYCRQGHVEQAKEILRNILELHPDDEPTMIKLKKLTGEKNIIKVTPLDQYLKIEKQYRLFAEKLLSHSEKF